MTIRIVPNPEIITIPVKVFTIVELVARYAVSNQADGKSPRTVKWYTEILTSFSDYARNKLHNDDMSIFTLEVVRGYILFLRQKPCFEGHPYTPQQDRPLSVETLRCHCRALKAFASWLHEEGYTTENRLKNLKLPKAPTKMMQPLTPEEIEQMSGCINMNSSTGTRNHTIIVTALDTGLRASEIAGIELGKLNLQGGYIRVTGKGAKERIVPIGKYVQMIMWHYIDKVRPKDVDGDCENLFLSREGRPITGNTIKLVFSRLAKSSGLKRLHAHLCRHSFAINYLMNGGDIFSLREILGHTTFEMVNHYLHFTTSQITEQHHKFSPMDKMKWKLN
jgi:site-specific recombinase XerD